MKAFELQEEPMTIIMESFYVWMLMRDVACRPGYRQLFPSTAVYPLVEYTLRWCIDGSRLVP